MVKNFRTTSPVAGRTIFHVNPSTDLNNLLLPGAASPPCHTVMVHCALTPSVEQTEGRAAFEKGDSHELADKESIQGKNKPDLLNAIEHCHKGITRKISGERNNGKHHVPNVRQPTALKNGTTSTNSKEKHTKSRLPIPAARQGLVRNNKKVIESQYASYFRPDTAPLYKTRPQTPTARPSTQR